MISGININPSDLTVGTANKQPEDLKGAAKAFESLFVNEMLKSMRKANEALMSSSDDIPLMGDDVRFFHSMFDSQLAQHLSENSENGTGGLGIAQALIRQLGEQGSENLPANTKVQREIGKSSFELLGTP